MHIASCTVRSSSLHGLHPSHCGADQWVFCDDSMMVCEILGMNTFCELKLVPDISSTEMLHCSTPLHIVEMQWRIYTHNAEESCQTTYAPVLWNDHTSCIQVPHPSLYAKMSEHMLRQAGRGTLNGNITHFRCPRNAYMFKSTASQASPASVSIVSNSWMAIVPGIQVLVISRSHHQRCLLQQPRTLLLQRMFLQLSVAWACQLLSLWAVQRLLLPLCCHSEKLPVQ